MCAGDSAPEGSRLKEFIIVGLIGIFVPIIFF
jgi:hypothetical protein